MKQSPLNFFRAKLGELIAKELAKLQAEVVTYNYTQAAELLNVSRVTVYNLEKEGKIHFIKGKISLAKLVEYRRNELTLSESENEMPEINRRINKPKRRKF